MHTISLVYESLSSRILLFSIGETQSSMRLNDPLALDLEYTRDGETDDPASTVPWAGKGFHLNAPRVIITLPCETTMERKTARLTLLIDPNKKAAFERLCARQDRTPSQIVRQLIRDYLAQHDVHDMRDEGSDAPAKLSDTAEMKPPRASGAGSNRSSRLTPAPPRPPRPPKRKRA